MTSPNLTFEIVWLDDFRLTPNGAAVIARETIRRRDLTAAITAACNKLKSGQGSARHARGFIVQSMER
jgi:hypothetical protein